MVTTSVATTTSASLTSSTSTTKSYNTNLTQSNSKIFNSAPSKCSYSSSSCPPKAESLSPVSNFNTPVFPAVLDRGATLLQKSKVPPPVPPRGNTKSKRDMPANLGNLESSFNSSINWIPTQKEDLKAGEIKSA